MNSKSIISAFRSRYGHLKKFGLKIHGEANLIGDISVISISTPFIFDNRLIPDEFMGLPVRKGVNETDLPDDFKNIDTDKEYIWAYQRFEKFVDNNGNLIKQTLGNPDMTRQEMLDALCYGDFNKHRANCIQWEIGGRIPKWSKST